MFNLIQKFFGWLLSPIFNVLNFPVVPVELVQIIDQVFAYMKAGMGILNFFCPLSIIKPALVVFLAVYLVYHGYGLVMWILRKIPFIGVE